MYSSTIPRQSPSLDYLPGPSHSPSPGPPEGSTICNGKARGNCPSGITGLSNKLPTYNNENLCYQLTNQQYPDKSLKIMVTETCGGNCLADNPDTDCPTLGASQYDPSKRDYPSQLCSQNNPNNIITGNGAPSGPYATSQGTCGDASKHKDWCSGYYAHFDIDQAKTAALMDGGTGLVNYKKIPCQGGT